MEPRNLDDRLIRRYLLGDVTPEEQRQIEKHVFGDQRDLSRLDRIENELIDEYLSGDLSDESRARFETHFMNAPERRERVAFAKALNSYVLVKKMPLSTLEPSAADHQKSLVAESSRRSVTRARAMFQTLTLCAVVVLGILLVRLSADRARIKTQLDQARAAQADFARQEAELRREVDEQHTRSEELAQALKRENEKLIALAEESRRRPPHSVSRIEPSLQALVLFPGVTRGQEEVATLVVAPGQNSVRLALIMGKARYERYSVSLISVQGNKQVWSQEGLDRTKTRYGEAIVTALPVHQLTMADYLVELHGIARDKSERKLATYLFHVLVK
jgi:anti-sigma factor RsiW